MKIDYTVPESTKYYGCLDFNLRYSYRHIYTAGTITYLNFYSYITGYDLRVAGLCEAIYHSIMGFMEFIPVVGHLIGVIDRSINEKKLEVLHLKGEDPYQLGLCQGKLLKKDIHYAIGKVMKLFEQRALMARIRPLKEAKKLEPFIPVEYLQEMRGIADGAGIEYEKVLIANTITDIVNLFGCSLYGVSTDEQTNTTERELAANHFESLDREPCRDVDESFDRYDTMKAKDLKDPSISDLKKTLKDVNYYDTVQSIIFDVNNCDMHIAVAGEYAANRKFTHFTSEEMFGNNSQRDVGTRKKVVKLARNMDWPLKEMGPRTVLFKRPAIGSKKATVIAGWPGLIGAFSGMNEKGTAISITVVPSKRQEGIPNSFLMRKILEESETISEAEAIVANHNPASAMNLIVAARDGVSLMELDPARQQRGAANKTYPPEKKSLFQKISGFFF
jgi:hypothetical protein